MLIFSELTCCLVVGSIDSVVSMCMFSFDSAFIVAAVPQCGQNLLSTGIELLHLIHIFSSISSPFPVENNFPAYNMRQKPDFYVFR